MLYPDQLHIGDVLEETLYATVYRAENPKDGKQLLVKRFKVDHPSRTDLARFRHEVERIRQAGIEGVARILGMVVEPGDVSVVLEDFDGVALSSYTRQRLSLDAFLDMAVRLVQTLHALHDHNITHRALSPSSIRYNTRTKAVQVMDFGVESELTGRNREVFNPKVVTGNLAYIAPEQTGRLNVEVDYRADFYALGATFYQLLTGRAPFTHRDPLALIHAHIAKPPTKPTTLAPEVPEPLSQITLKLLAKSPEERYQSTQGLIADLLECQQQLRRAGTVRPFEIGRRDNSPRFIPPQTLVGRETEQHRLFEAFQRASEGAMVLTLVSGAPGVGKSALVSEINKPLAATRGHFITGKFDKLRQYVPHSAFIQAGQTLALYLLAENESRIQMWRRRLVAALGSNGRVLTDIIPEFELILGPQPELPELPPEEAQNRFKSTLMRFISVFADAEHPLVLFLDDLQWADSASLELIDALAQERRLGHFLIIGAYRANEAVDDHPLVRLRANLGSYPIEVDDIQLGPLSKPDVTQLLSTFLRCEPERAESLAEIVHEKTLGNPFFVNQFLRDLYEGGALRLDAEHGWQWDETTIRPMQVTDNVVHFMTEKLMKLPPTALDVIRTGSCMGNRFDAETLGVLMDTDLANVIAAVDTLTQEGLVTRRGETYAFCHDRIREAAYALLSSQEREHFHYRIGCLMLEGTASADLDRRIFYIVDQLNEGHRLVTEREERNRLAELNLRAGIKAKHSTAYDAALGYIQRGMEMLPESPWKRVYRLTYELYTELMECQYLARRPEESERLFNTIIAHASNNIDKADAYRTMVIMYTNMKTAREAAALGVEGLNLVGARISLKATPLSVLKGLVETRLRLRRINLEDLPHAPEMRDQETLSRNALLIETGTAAYFVNPYLFASTILKGVNDTLKHGNHPGAALSYIALGTIIQTQGNYDLAYRLSQMALKLDNRSEKNKRSANVRHVYAFFIQHWTHHARESIAGYGQVYRVAQETGNFLFMGYAIGASSDMRLMLGDSLNDIRAEHEKYRELLERVKDRFITARYTENAQFIKALQGMTDSRVSLDSTAFDWKRHIDQFKEEDNYFGLGYSLLYQVKLYYLFGDYRKARIAADELDRYIHAHVGTFIVSEHYFYYSLAMIGEAAEQGGPAPRKLRKLVYRNQAKLDRWAKRCPQNFRHKHELVRGGLKALTGDLPGAVSAYHRAIRGANENEYTHEEAIACERLGELYERFEAEEEMAVFLRRAYRRYGQWAATAKQDELVERYPWLSQSERFAPAHPDTPGTTQNTSRLLDLTTVMQVSQALSGEIVLERLLERTIHIALTNAGAERGALLLRHEDGHITLEVTEDLGRDHALTTGALPLEEAGNVSHGVVRYVAHSRNRVILANAAKEGAFTSDRYIQANQCKSILCMPLQSKGQLDWLLYMENNLTADTFTQERVELLSMVASQAAISLENARLFELATTDGLTRLYVHRYLQVLLDQELERAKRADSCLSVVMFDIDNFKQFNDTYGHQLGDEALRMVADALQRAARSQDIAARYGGEEFVLVMPEAETEQAVAMAERIRAHIAGLRIRYEHGDVPITVSLGVATYPIHAADKDALISEADQALYLAKHKGKNCVASADETPMMQYS